jgi:hypothetical protein
VDWLWLHVACGYLLGRFIVGCVNITVEAVFDLAHEADVAAQRVK